MFELNKANPFIFRLKMMNIPIVTFSCFILSAIIILLGFSSFPGNVFSQLDEAGMSETIKNCNFAATQVASDQSLTQEVKDAAEQFLTSCDGFISTTKNFCQSDPSPSFCTESGLDDYLALRPSQ